MTTTTSSSGRAAMKGMKSSSPPSKSITVWKSSKLWVTETWNVDAAYYAAVWSAILRVSMRETKIVKARLHKTYEGIIRPQLQAVMALASGLCVRVKDSESFAVVQAKLLKIHRQMKHVVLSASKANERKESSDLEAVAGNAKGARAVLDWKLTVAVAQNAVEKIGRSSAAQQIRRTARKVATNPVVHKVADAVVAALLNATVTL